MSARVPVRVLPLVRAYAPRGRREGVTTPRVHASHGGVLSPAPAVTDLPRTKPPIPDGLAEA
jgi:hypothetical protein